MTLLQTKQVSVHADGRTSPLCPVVHRAVHKAGRLV